ncbi:hypothetical protein GCM10023075_48190 [Streptosporangium album]
MRSYTGFTGVSPLRRPGGEDVLRRVHVPITGRAAGAHPFPDDRGGEPVQMVTAPVTDPGVHPAALCRVSFPGLKPGVSTLKEIR